MDTRSVFDQSPKAPNAMASPSAGAGPSSFPNFSRPIGNPSRMYNAHDKASSMSTERDMTMAKTFPSSSPFAAFVSNDKSSTTVSAAGMPLANQNLSSRLPGSFEFNSDQSLTAGQPVMPMMNYHSPLLSFSSSNRPEEPLTAFPLQSAKPAFRNYLFADGQISTTQVEGDLGGLFTSLINYAPVSQRRRCQHRLASVYVETGQLLVSSKIPPSVAERLDFVLNWIKTVCLTVGVEPPPLPPIDDFQWDNLQTGTVRVSFPATQTTHTEIDMLATATAAITLGDMAATPHLDGPPRSSSLAEWEKERSQRKMAERPSKRERKAAAKAMMEVQKANAPNKVSGGRVGKPSKSQRKKDPRRRKNLSEKLVGLDCGDGDFLGADKNDVDMKGGGTSHGEGSGKAGNHMLPAHNKISLCTGVQTDQEGRDLEMAE